jgi:undecaprenyl-diphosphatase
VASLDDEIMRFVAAHRTPAMTTIAQGIQNAGGSDQVLVGVGVAALALVVALRAWRVGLAGVLALAAAAVATGVLKELVQRPRPADAVTVLPVDGWAMPSGHAMRIAAVSVALLVAAGWSASGERRTLALALLWTVVALNVALGVTMVYLGAHWPTDVLAGWALGGALGWMIGRLCSVTLGPRRGG